MNFAEKFHKIFFWKKLSEIYYRKCLFKSLRNLYKNLLNHSTASISGIPNYFLKISFVNFQIILWKIITNGRCGWDGCDPTFIFQWSDDPTIGSSINNVVKGRTTKHVVLIRAIIITNNDFLEEIVLLRRILPNDRSRQLKSANHTRMVEWPPCFE